MGGYCGVAGRFLSLGRGSVTRYGIGHVNIRVGIMNSLECVCFPLHEHLGGE